MSPPAHWNPPPKFGLRVRGVLPIIAHCPDCGMGITEYHVAHRCPTLVWQSDEGAYSVSYSHSYDALVVPRSAFKIS